MTRSNHIAKLVGQEAAMHAALATGIPLLDAVTVAHGPLGEMGRFFLMADEAARQLGIRLLLHSSMASLIEVNEALSEIWGTPMVPIFNPHVSRMSPANSFWISGHDASGRVVATQGARLIDMTGTTALEESVSLRLFYADPGKMLAKGMRITVAEEADAAMRAVTGRTVFSGGAWHHPDVRSRGLSAILPRISRNLAYTRWKHDWTFSMVEEVLARKDVHRRYGYTSSAPVVRILNSYREDLTMRFVWMDSAQLLSDMLSYVSATAGNDIRRAVEDETKLAPRVLQGSSRRS